VNSAVFDTSTFAEAASSAVSSVNTWFHCGGEWISTTSRASLLNGANRGTNTTSVNPAASDRVYIGHLAVDNEIMGSTDGIAEISIWDGAGMTTGNMDSLLGKLYNGGAAGAGGNPLNITVEAAQPWTGKLVAYWPLTNTTDLADASGNGHNLTMQGTLTNFASHPTIEAAGSPVPNTPIRPPTTVSIVP